MVWKRLFGRGESGTEPAPAATEPATRRPRRTDTPATNDPALRARLDQLRRRRELVLFDVERAEAATRPENPWRERVALLDEALTTVEADLAAVEREPREPSFPLAETPIIAVAATAGEPASVNFEIGGERFRFEEETDWDQRGGPIVRGELRRREGGVERLVPAATRDDLRPVLTEHLRRSAAVFAADLRDRALEGEALPESATLADLAQPCPICGGWRDWRGTCDRCADRALRRQRLRAEAERLMKEREAEAAERRKWAERLPIARRRLRDVEAEIAVATGTGGGGAT